LARKPDDTAKLLQYPVRDDAALEQLSTMVTAAQPRTPDRRSVAKADTPDSPAVPKTPEVGANKGSRRARALIFTSRRLSVTAISGAAPCAAVISMPAMVTAPPN
jgi:hypothetical protein